MGLHSIILDAGPLLSNEPSISTLLAKSERIYTTTAVVSELRDKDARARLQTTVLPFLTIHNPSLASVKVVTDFARRTGDLAVLSKTDIGILALAYELECERNHGDWRLRKVPGQKGLNGSAPLTIEPKQVLATRAEVQVKSASKITHPLNQSVGSYIQEASPARTLKEGSQDSVGKDLLDKVSKVADPPEKKSRPAESDTTLQEPTNSSKLPLEREDNLGLDFTTFEISNRSDSAKPKFTNETTTELNASHAIDVEAESGAASSAHILAVSEPHQSPESTHLPDQDSSDSEGWITPANLKKHQVKDQNASATPVAEEKTMQVSTITSDFAMQNVLLQMNLNLLSPSLLRIKHLKTFILRCHACFQTTKQMDKQFCPRCGKPTLTRVSCSTNAQGEFQIHLKKNMQWNTRGDRYSIPKPVSGTSNGKFGTAKGGGKGGWGQDLILAEDQKEYMRAMQVEGRKKERNLMDEDYLPSILTGSRGKAGGRPKVGAGRNVNAKKRS